MSLELSRKVSGLQAASRAKLLGYLVVWALVSLHVVCASDLVRFTTVKNEEALQESSRYIRANYRSEIQRGETNAARLCGEGQTLDLNVEPNRVFMEGAKLDIEVSLDKFHPGLFEFRVCDVTNKAGDSISQECFNAHVLELDTSDFIREQAIGLPNTSQTVNLSRHYNSGWKCPKDSPRGSCCNDGGSCSPVNANTHRFMLLDNEEKSLTYNMRYSLPPEFSCSMCVLQWLYQSSSGDTKHSRTASSYRDCTVIEVRPQAYAISSESSNDDYGLWQPVKGREYIERQMTTETCWAINSTDHSYCRSVDCAQKWIALGICTTDDPYDGVVSTAAPTAAPTEDPSSLMNDSATSNNTLTDSIAASSKSTEIGAIVGSLGGALVMGGVALVYIRKRKSHPSSELHIVQAIPVATEDSNDDPASQRPKQSTNPLMFRGLFSTPSSAKPSIQAKDIEMVVVARPVE